MFADQHNDQIMLSVFLYVDCQLKFVSSDTKHIAVHNVLLKTTKKNHVNQ